MSVDVYVNIVYIMPTIGQCMSVGVYIDIGYILPIIGGYVKVVGCLWALQGRYVCQLLLNLYCIYHANNHGMYVSWYIHWYCIYSANNWGICISCWVSVGPSGPGHCRGGMYVSCCIH